MGTCSSGVIGNSEFLFAASVQKNFRLFLGETALGMYNATWYDNTSHYFLLKIRKKTISCRKN